MSNRLFSALFGGKESGNVKMVSPATVAEWLQADQVVLIDVRETNEHASERIAGAINMPLSTLDPAKIPAIPEGKKLVFHCRSGQRCGMAAGKLVAAGYGGEINRLEGGIMNWSACGLPITR